MQTDNNLTRKKSRLNTLLRAALILFAGLTTGLCLYVVNVSVFTGDRMPMPFGYGAGIVLSGSMEPELRVDDVIIVHRETSYQVGDVVVYRSGRSAVVHRIVQVSGSDVITKGDANNAADEPIRLSDINGKVVARIPRAGTVVDYIRSPLGVILVLGAAIALLELSFRDEKRRGQRDIERIRAEIEELRSKTGQYFSDE